MESSQFKVSKVSNGLIIETEEVVESVLSPVSNSEACGRHSEGPRGVDEDHDNMCNMSLVYEEEEVSLITETSGDVKDIVPTDSVIAANDISGLLEQFLQYEKGITNGSTGDQHNLLTPASSPIFQYCSYETESCYSDAVEPENQGLEPTPPITPTESQDIGQSLGETSPVKSVDKCQIELETPSSPTRTGQGVCSGVEESEEEGEVEKAEPADSVVTMDLKGRVSEKPAALKSPFLELLASKSRLMAASDQKQTSQETSNVSLPNLESENMSKKSSETRKTRAPKRGRPLEKSPTSCLLVGSRPRLQSESDSCEDAIPKKLKMSSTSSGPKTGGENTPTSISSRRSFSNGKRSRSRPRSGVSSQKDSRYKRRRSLSKSPSRFTSRELSRSRSRSSSRARSTSRARSRSSSRARSTSRTRSRSWSRGKPRSYTRRKSLSVSSESDDCSTCSSCSECADQRKEKRKRRSKNGPYEDRCSPPRVPRSLPGRKRKYSSLSDDDMYYAHKRVRRVEYPTRGTSSTKSSPRGPWKERKQRSQKASEFQDNKLKYSFNKYFDEDIHGRLTELAAPVPYDIEKERKLKFLFGGEKECGDFQRRNVYAGGIAPGSSKRDIERRFDRFGPIDRITLHFRQKGDNYAFIVFHYAEDAARAIREGNDDPHNRRLDLCFGGRRKFVGGSYVDFDGNVSFLEENEVPAKQVSRSPSPENDFDSLLRMAQKDIRK